MMGYPRTVSPFEPGGGISSRHCPAPCAIWAQKVAGAALARYPASSADALGLWYATPGGFAAARILDVRVRDISDAGTPEFGTPYVAFAKEISSTAHFLYRGYAGVLRAWKVEHEMSVTEGSEQIRTFVESHMALDAVSAATMLSLEGRCNLATSRYDWSQWQGYRHLMRNMRARDHIPYMKTAQHLARHLDYVKVWALDLPRLRGDATVRTPIIAVAHPRMTEVGERIEEALIAYGLHHVALSCGAAVKCTRAVPCRSECFAQTSAFRCFTREPALINDDVRNWMAQRVAWIHERTSGTQSSHSVATSMSKEVVLSVASPLPRSHRTVRYAYRFTPRKG